MKPGRERVVVAFAPLWSFDILPPAFKGFGAVVGLGGSNAFAVIPKPATARERLSKTPVATFIIFLYIFISSIHKIFNDFF